MFETVIRAAGAAQNNYQALQGFNRPQESGWAICKSEDLSDAVEFSVFMNMDYSGECKIISSPVEEGGLSPTTAPRRLPPSVCRSPSKVCPMSL